MFKILFDSLRRAKTDGAFEPPRPPTASEMRVIRREPPVEVVIPEGANLRPAFSIRVEGLSPYRDREIGVTFDAEEALRVLRSSRNIEVELIGAYYLPDGRIVAPQPFVDKKLIGRDVMILADGKVEKIRG